MEIENLGNVATSLISGTATGVIIGYAVKKVLKIGLVILGIFFSAIAYLQLQGLLNVNMDKLESISKSALSGLINSDISGTSANSILSSMGLPLTGGMALGFVLGFMKG